MLRDELQKHLDEQLANAKQVSKLVSDTVRTVNFGLAALFFVASSHTTQDVKSDTVGQLTLTLAASAGVLGIVFDVLQNLASLDHCYKLIGKAEKILKEGTEVTSRDEFMTLDSDLYPRLREYSFVAKIGMAAIGVLLLGFLLFGFGTI